MKRHINITPLVWIFVILMPISLLFATVSRLFFAWVNFDEFASLSSHSWLQAILHGVRFDLSAWAYLNSVLVLLAVFLPIVFRWKPLRKVLVGLTVLANVLLVVVGFLDALYFAYSGRRSGTFVFGMMGDLQEQLGHLLITFGGYLLLILLLVGLFSYPLLRSWPKRQFTVHWLAYLPLGFLVVALTVLAGRGSLGSKPLKAAHAFTWPDATAGNLVLNTAFAMQASTRDGLPEKSYFASDSEALSAWLAKPDPANCSYEPPAQPRTDNVVVLIVESLGYEMFKRANGEQSYAPFIESLIDDSLHFEHAIANGRRSIDVLPAVLGGIPALMDSPFANSKYQTNDVVGLGTLLHQQGYDTAFFHGTKNGSMYMDAMSQRFGFKEYFGKFEYPDKAHHDGAWGIYDRPFLQFTSEQISQMTPPFAVGIKTLSSHNPYSVEEEYLDQLGDLPTPFLRSMRYADLAVEQFFAHAKEQPWYENTLFVITGDHAVPGHESIGLYKDLVGRYRVGLLMYHPGGKLPAKNSTQLAQHVDIPQTILGFLGRQQGTEQLTAFGRNLLCEQPGQAVVTERGGYHLIDDSLSVLSSDSQVQPLSPELNSEQLHVLQSYVQLFNNGMERDRLRSDKLSL